MSDIINDLRSLIVYNDTPSQFKAYHIPLRHYYHHAELSQKLPSIRDLGLYRPEQQNRSVPTQYKIVSTKTSQVSLTERRCASPKPNQNDFIVRKSRSPSTSDNISHGSESVDMGRRRKRIDNWKRNILNQVFEQHFFPSAEIRKRLSKQLGMESRAVQIWFQNKRQEWRTKNKEQEPTDSLINNLLTNNVLNHNVADSTTSTSISTSPNASNYKNLSNPMISQSFNFTPRLLH